MTSYKFISPTGAVVKGKNLKKFCDENKLGYLPMLRLLKGKYASNNGWYACHAKSKKQLEKERQKLYNTKTGETAVLGNSHQVFAKTHGLHHSVLGELLRGSRTVYKHWMTEKTYKLLHGPTLS